MNLYKLIYVINLSKSQNAQHWEFIRIRTVDFKILMCPCRCIDFNKSITLGPDADSGGRYVCVG